MNALIKEAVDAKVVTGLSTTFGEALGTFDESTSYLNDYPVTITYADKSTGTITMNVNASPAYNAGVRKGNEAGKKSVKITSVGRTAGTTDSWDSSDKLFTVQLTAAADNGETLAGSVTVNGQRAYSAGQSSKSISSVTEPPNLDDYPFSSRYTTITFDLQINLSDGTHVTKSVTAKAGNAYNAGYAAGKKAVSVKSISDVSVNGDYVSFKVNLNNDTSSTHKIKAF